MAYDNTLCVQSQCPNWHECWRAIVNHNRLVGKRQSVFAPDYKKPGGCDYFEPIEPEAA